MKITSPTVVNVNIKAGVKTNASFTFTSDTECEIRMTGSCGCTAIENPVRKVKANTIEEVNFTIQRNSPLDGSISFYSKNEGDKLWTSAHSLKVTATLIN